jgi:hypothetical protein
MGSIDLSFERLCKQRVVARRTVAQNGAAARKAQRTPKSASWRYQGTPAEVLPQSQWG